eukprot:1153980-Pelagomonas_calceolata.AAC.1
MSRFIMSSRCRCLDSAAGNRHLAQMTPEAPVAEATAASSKAQQRAGGAGAKAAGCWLEQYVSEMQMKREADGWVEIANEIGCKEGREGMSK